MKLPFELGFIFFQNRFIFPALKPQATSCKLQNRHLQSIV